MRSHRLLAIALVLLSFVAMPDLCFQLAWVNNINEVIAANPSTFQSANPPKITKAVMQKKTLLVEGENFVDGAKLYVNGAKVKAFNDEITPTTKLVVNKANKRLPREEVVSLEVQTPDGQTSETFGFFTGFALNAHNITPSAVFLEVGQKFLLHFNDPGISWQIHYPPTVAPEVIELLSIANSLIPDSQGLYQAKQVGNSSFVMRGFPVNGDPPFFFYVNLFVR